MPKGPSALSVLLLLAFLAPSAPAQANCALVIGADLYPGSHVKSGCSYSDPHHATMSVRIKNTCKQSARINVKFGIKNGPNDLRTQDIAPGQAATFNSSCGASGQYTYWTE